MPLGLGTEPTRKRLEMHWKEGRKRGRGSEREARKKKGSMHGRKGSNASKEGSPRSVHGRGTFDSAGDVNLSCGRQVLVAREGG